MSDLASMYETASMREKLKLCASLLSGIQKKPMQTQESEIIDLPAGMAVSSVVPPECEIARIALAAAIITEALACGPGS